MISNLATMKQKQKKNIVLIYLLYKLNVKIAPRNGHS